MSQPSGYRPGSLLALDFGLRRIGVASAALITATATPLTTLAARNGDPDWEALDALIGEWAPDLLVLGLPTNSDGTESDMTRRVRDFMAELQARYKLPIELMDERYTSAEAEAILRDQRSSGVRNKKLKKEDVDSLAAALIAESWMRSHAKQS